MPEHELWEGLDLVEMYKVTITQFHFPPLALSIAFHPQVLLPIAKMNLKKEVICFSLIAFKTFITFQIRSIKPRVQNVLDTLETVTIDLSKSYFLSQHWDEVKLGKTFDNRLKIRERKRQLLQLSTTWTYFRREVKDLPQ